MINATPFPITLALTGASGSRYGLRLLERLLQAERRVDLLVSDASRVVMRQECDVALLGDGDELIKTLDQYYRSNSATPPDLTGLRHYGLNDWNAPMATGSSEVRAMVVCPCSMGSVAAIARGASDNLIERAADVAIKEGWPLLLVPRETPFSVIHLDNMLRLAQAGVVILPASPGFYHRPTSLDQLVDFIVDRILARLGIFSADP
ncbi:MAG: UbiX family flavin prenyltransferase [Magnetococcales bacterium]|nr:UbiX family flavin prenyltransferase [Magnetococcales bacterium]MBF0439439.1 UbiX family flavin prenyltransferase [Magnetococcales bacterium]